MTSALKTTHSRAGKRRAAALVAAVSSAFILLAGCDATGGDHAVVRETPARSVPARSPNGSHFPATVAAGKLVSFDSCEQLLDYYRSHAKPLVGAYGLGGGYWGWRRQAAIPGARGAAADGAALATATTPKAGEGYSGTNNQEIGVDEADQVKTDGRIIVTAQGGRIHVTDAAAATALATLSIPRAREASSELLLSGKTLIVLSTTTGQVMDPVADMTRGLRVPGFPSERTTVTRVDLSDPKSPKVLGAVRMEGSYRSARMIGDAVRMVMVTQPPGLTFSQPKDSSMTAEEEAKRANQQVITDSTIDDWVPHVQELNPQGETEGTERLTDCAAVIRPKDFAGLATLSVVTFDVGGTEQRVAPTSTLGVVASGDTVYASTDRLIVATSPWDLWTAGWIRRPDPVKMTTALHAFDISNPAATAYTGSGAVAGRLVNQFALDDYEGTIRVATTTSDEEWREDSQSSLLVLREQNGELVRIGQVDGMGLTEQIRSVRYLTPELAAIVTFRQTDPLYLVDSSDPTAPKVAGELKIPGYSAYLHPLETDDLNGYRQEGFARFDGTINRNGLLLGVGQDADPKSGQTKGLQASLFDISDPSAPVRLDQVTWTNTNSPAEWDHRAFLWWKGSAYLPASSWSESADGPNGFGGVLSLAVANRALTKGKQVSTESAKGYGGGPQRVLVIGADLWTLDSRRLQRFDLATLTHEASVPLSS